MKLRFSRKLLFIWGLLAAFAGDLFASPELHQVENDEQYFLMLAELIRSQTDVPPLELLARSSLSISSAGMIDSMMSGQSAGTR